MYDLYLRDVKNIDPGESTRNHYPYVFNEQQQQQGKTLWAHEILSGLSAIFNLMIGGRKPDGTDGTNELSLLCIEAMNLAKMAEPNFSMRYNTDTPRDLLRLAAKLIRTGCGMPSMFNDQVAVKGLMELGIPQEDALDYCAIGCVRDRCAGQIRASLNRHDLCKLGKNDGACIK